jgi:hypothetical protein
LTIVPLAVTVDRDVERLARRGDRALAELLLHFRHLRANADLVVHGGGHRIRVHIGELRLALLETDRVRVGNVVADHIEVVRRAGQTR